MRILITNSDYVDDIYNQSWTGKLNWIRKLNTKGGGVMEIFDPYGEDGECTLGGVDMIFSFGRTRLCNGIFAIYSMYKDTYTDSYGYPCIKVKDEINIDPYYIPFLSLETLVAYMPHIPWDDFGNHMRLEGNDAKQFLKIWNTFLQQNKALYNAVYNMEYPLDDENSNMGYIFMNKEIE